MTTSTSIGLYDFVMGAPSKERYKFNKSIKVLVIDPTLSKYKGSNNKEQTLRDLFQDILLKEGLPYQAIT
jgi:hypothetical protein